MAQSMEIDFDSLRLELQADYNELVALSNEHYDEENNKLVLKGVDVITYQNLLSSMQYNLAFLMCMNEQDTHINNIGDKCHFEALDF